jgi:uncharacterized protein (TIGR02231 family)|tara:strand:- start:1826 stop:3505 length:1680 start_codon:yes stop_codon:yes gene_type:complete
MKFLCTTAFVTLITTSIFALQPVTVEMEPINANASVSGVTLYRGRAAVTRTTELDLEAGGWSVFFRDLPSSATLDSVQASVHGDAKLVAVDTTSFPLAKDNNKLLAVINQEIDYVEEKIALSQSEEQSIKVQITFLETLVLRSSTEKENIVDLASFQEQLVFIGKQMASLESQKFTNKKLREELTNERNTLIKQRNNLANENRVQRDAIVNIVVLAEGAVTIEVTYLCNSASWEPSYSIRASEGGEAIAIDYDANLTQFTGEDWKDVNLTLSTAQPQRSASPPKLSPWPVDIQEPAQTRSKTGRVTPPAAYATDSIVEAESERSLEQKFGSAVAAASVLGDGPAVSFVLPRTISVPSNKSDTQKTAIATIEATASLFRVAIPMITDSVFIRSEVKNDSPFILLPGEASIFHGSDFVGRTALPTIAPSETFPLDLGVDPKVIATRTLLGKKTSSTGLFGSSKETLYDYRVTVSNGHDTPLDIQLWDRIPVSQNKEIEIGLKKQSQALSSDAHYLQTDFPLGLLRWDISIPANSTGESNFVLTWQVDVGRGKDVKMTPLPE